MIVYNSHGRWNTVAWIRQLEVNERGNDFYVPTIFDECLCIWVTFDPVKAYEYDIPGDSDYFYHSLPLLEKQRIALEHITSFMVEPYHILLNYDGDGGFLLIDLSQSNG